jgi:hypothetical protein
MTKMWRSLLTSMVIVLVVLAPACKTTKKKVDTKPILETAQTTVPDISATTDTATAVEPPRDFVKPEAEPAEEPFPSEIDKANKVARAATSATRFSTTTRRRSTATRRRR